MYGDIFYRYSVIPQNIALVQSFEIPQGELPIDFDYFLSVGTFSNNYKFNNTICLRETGYAYSSQILNNQTNNRINATWIGQDIGTALNYLVFSGKSLFFFSTKIEGPDNFGPPPVVDIG